MPAEQRKRWVLEAFDAHPERQNWNEVEAGPGGLVVAGDGALVLMAHLRMPANIGVWLKPEGTVIHCSETNGVCAETPLALRAQGWRVLRYFEQCKTPYPRPLRRRHTVATNEPFRSSRRESEVPAREEDC